MNIGTHASLRFKDMFDYPLTVEPLKECDYDNCPLKSIIELNPLVNGNEKCRTNDSRRGTKVIKANRFAHATHTVVKYRDKCGIDLEALLSTMPSFIRKVL